MKKFNQFLLVKIMLFFRQAKQSKAKTNHQTKAFLSKGQNDST
jgi:hypothetical protein